MDLYPTLFWLGFFILIAAHIQLLMKHMQTATRQHAMIALTGTAMMFVGSKLGREFLENFFKFKF
jgi:uncharacterized membrane protein